MEQTVKERVKELIKKEGIFQTEFEDRIGASNGYVNNISKSIGGKYLLAIQREFPHINIDWLLYGEGEMLKGDSQELPETSLDVKIYKKKVSKNLIPFYDAETTGGNVGRVSDSTVPVSLVGYIDPGDWFYGTVTAAMRHVGDSMTEYPNGCIMLVREIEDIRLLVPGRNYVIETTEYRVTKKLQFSNDGDVLRLHSTNREKYEDGTLIHQPFNVHLSDVRHIYSIVGYVVSQCGENHFVRIR